MSHRIRILDTGTTAADANPDAATVYHQPALVRRTLPFDLPAVLDDRPCHVVFYSRFAVRTVAYRLKDSEQHRLWAVGPKTAAVVEQLVGRTAEFADEHHFQALRDALADCGDPRPVIAFGLKDTNRDLSPVTDGWNSSFHPVDVYESTPAPAGELRRVFNDIQPHWIALTSSRGARAVADAVDIDRLTDVNIAAIGDSTAATISELGLTTDLVPDNPDRNQLIEAIAATIHNQPPTNNQ